MSTSADIIAMVPARMGSTRLAMKNLALLQGKPLIYYALQAAKDAGIFKRIVINSEDEVFAKIAGRYGVEFYKRPAEFASSAAKSDFVVYDFLKNNPCDILAWVNSIAPLQDGREIRAVVEHFLRENLDALITVEDKQVHCIYQGRPVNFSLSDVFARTQDLEPVQPFVYSLMIWRRGVFMREFEEKGQAFFCGKAGFYPVSKLSAMIIKKKEDLMLAQSLLDVLGRQDDYKVEYDPLIEGKVAER